MRIFKEHLCSGRCFGILKIHLLIFSLKKNLAGAVFLYLSSRLSSKKHSDALHVAVAFLSLVLTDFLFLQVWM